MTQRILGALLCALLYAGCTDASAYSEGERDGPTRQILNVVRVFMNNVDEDEFRYTFLTEEFYAGDAPLWRHHYYRLNRSDCWGDPSRHGEVVFYPDVPRSSKHLWVDVYRCNNNPLGSYEQEYQEYKDVYKLGIHVRSPEDVSGGGWDTGGKNPVRGQTNVVQ